jgi:hypothetical protein
MGINILPLNPTQLGSRMVGLLPSQLLHAGSLLGWFSTLKMEVICFSETSVHIRTIWCYIPEDGNSHSYRCENLKYYKVKLSLCLIKRHSVDTYGGVEV